jgi:hypothetical protein
LAYFVYVVVGVVADEKRKRLLRKWSLKGENVHGLGLDPYRDRR